MALVNASDVGVITTGQSEIDKKLGGGIPVGSLIFIEGQSDSGKSVFTQQLTWGSLRSGYNVAMLTTENTVKSMLRHTKRLEPRHSGLPAPGPAEDIPDQGHALRKCH